MNGGTYLSTLYPSPSVDSTRVNMPLAGFSENTFNLGSLYNNSNSCDSVIIEFTPFLDRDDDDRFDAVTEDFDRDGNFDNVSEDVDGDGRLDLVNEDVDGDRATNPNPDVDEDVDNDGNLDLYNEDLSLIHISEPTRPY